MSSFLNEPVTPRPWKSGSAGFTEHNGESDTFDSRLGENPFEVTEGNDFTTEVRAPVLRGSRPQRANKTRQTFYIREENEDASAGRETRRRTAEVIKSSEGRKPSLLAQPAQRFRSNPGFPQETKHEILALPKVLVIEARNKNKPSILLGDKDLNKKTAGNSLKENARRNTVYIPPDDRAVPSVFMSIFSPPKQRSGTSMSQASDKTEINRFEPQITKRQARKTLAASGQRAPLQQSLKIAQVDPTAPDIPGTGGGKENLPPGKLLLPKDKDVTSDDVPSKPLFARRSATNAAALQAPRVNRAPTQLPPASQATSVNRTSTDLSAANQTPALNGVSDVSRTSVAKQATTASQTPTANRPFAASKASASNQTHATRHRGEKKAPPMIVTLGKMQGNAGNALKRPVRPAVPLSTRASLLPDRLGSFESSQNLSIDHIKTTLSEANHQFSLVVDNIAETALYEDNWLSYQETVISQLANGLFEHFDSSMATYDADAFRLGLLSIYHTAPFINLYKRLQNSLSCGYLKIPKESLTRGTRLHQNLGLKRTFLDIWLKSYDLRALVPALETVVGRQVFDDLTWLDGLNDGPGSVSSNKMVIRTVESYLETFLLRNDDIGQSTASVNDFGVGRYAKIYHRAVLRSIMLIALLDKSKECLGADFPCRLFEPSSAFKSSAGVFRALLSLLIPSCGAINRLLAHLNFQFSHKQHPLQEYNYKINIMAVDFQDGVRLARIVELLLILPQHLQSDPYASTFVSLPTGEVFSLVEGNLNLPLSQHLKFPCVSHAVKMFNVRFVLGALASQNSAATVLNSIQATDIVLGYREKTIALLWPLLGKWVLTGLVDWKDVRKEVTRLKHKAVAQLGYEAVKDENWFLGTELLDDEHAHLLQRWAGILAALRVLRVSDLTASFANGKIYRSIMDEYEPYIAGGVSESKNSSFPFSSISLQSRLQQLGCSAQFACLIAPHTTSHVLNCDTTLAALVFICSRMLSASKRARAATAIQRAWRSHSAKKMEGRREVARELAQNCATAVQVRTEVLGAVEVITRWWWEVKSRKQREKTFQRKAMRKSSARRSIGRKGVRRL
ncbi:hypothetical protein N7508_004115 [Penicillium antarcticum]|uniref:uncharacterized protein n=1 Tax=Penicillium antarcticum TaxID=416450 RepID=UPI00239E6587|nr:uncharacterized protein N7508_004115 [Penicillium antarcticum]KAJ5308736.1 hypothetical protein N7508_004115 [Penicillium antarcticum]